MELDFGNELYCITVVVLDCITHMHRNEGYEGLTTAA